MHFLNKYYLIFTSIYGLNIYCGARKKLEIATVTKTLRFGHSLSKDYLIFDIVSTINIRYYILYLEIINTDKVICIDVAIQIT